MFLGVAANGHRWLTSFAGLETFFSLRYGFLVGLGMLAVSVPFVTIVRFIVDGE
jgi:hypothetical protein